MKQFLAGLKSTLIGLLPQTARPDTPASGIVLYADATGHLSWLTTAGFKQLLDASGNTADRSYTLPDKSGQLAIIANSADLLALIADGTGTGANVFAEGCSLNNAKYNGAQTSTLGTTSVPVAGSLNLDLATGIKFLYTMSANTEFIPINTPTGYCSFCLRIAFTSGVADWTNFASLKWDDGLPPVFVATHIYDVIFTTDDVGTTWTGQIGGDFY